MVARLAPDEPSGSVSPDELAKIDERWVEFGALFTP
jgi:hypothetical protein